jgi:hypothetical protein
MKTAKDKYVMKKMGVDAEDKNESDTYEMPRQEAMDEHKRLIKILRTGSKAEQLKEADAQEKELNEYISGSENKTPDEKD